jgi:hypothetical protein
MVGGFLTGRDRELPRKRRRWRVRERDARVELGEGGDGESNAEVIEEMEEDGMERWEEVVVKRREDDGV